MLKHLEMLLWLEPRYLVTTFVMELFEFINTQMQPTALSTPGTLAKG